MQKKAVTKKKTRTVSETEPGRRKKAGAAAPAIDADSQGQVRDILIGLVSRDLQSRLEAMEERLAKISQELDHKTDERLTEMESRLRGELADRTTLSALFSEVALRVGGGIPGLSVDESASEVDLDGLFDSGTGKAP